jgi:valyl-tRNA synthetase
LRQDPDVLDTWFSSGLWPFSTLGWPQDTPDLRRYYPTSVLVTGYDILFFWVVRMMMFGLYAMDGTPPFTDVYLHGLIRDQYGKKMSKSRGNTVDPLELIDDFGADALRLTIARGSNPGADMALSAEWVAASRNFTTKLWNATRFALANGASPALPLPAEGSLAGPSIGTEGSLAGPSIGTEGSLAGPSIGGVRTDADTWILGRLREVREEVDALLEDYQFAKATEALYHFTWDELCDWYVELAKAQLADEATADGTRAVLGHVLDALLRLWHPIIPFVTEALWTALTDGESVVIAPWPSDAGITPDAGAAARITDLQKLITEIRRFRTEQGLPDRRRVAARTTGLDTVGPVGDGPGGGLAALASLVRLDEPGPDFAPTATIEVALAGGTVHVEIDTSGAIDVAAERARLGRDLVAARKELDQAERKLGNPKFVEKAPVDVVDGIRERHATAAADIERVTARLAALPQA